MRTPHASRTVVFLGLAVAAVLFAGLAGADETQTMPAPQKPIAQPFLDGLVGSWTTESTSLHEGKEYKGTGKATWTKGIGGTALLETYENNGPGPDGKPMNFHGHGVYKVADDGKTVTVWWFCNMSPKAMELTGTATDTGIELSGDGMHGGKMTLSFQESADGLTFKLTEGEMEMKETYRRAR